MKLILLILLGLSAASAQSVVARLDFERSLSLQLVCPDKQMACRMNVQAEYLDGTGRPSKADGYDVDVVHTIADGAVVPFELKLKLRTQDRWPDYLSVYRTDPAVRVKLTAPAP